MSESQSNNTLSDGIDIISKLQSVIKENKIKLDPQLERKLQLFIEQTSNASSKADTNVNRKTAPLMVPKPRAKVRPNLSKSKSMNAMVANRDDSKDEGLGSASQTRDAFVTELTSVVIKINETLKPIDLSNVQRLFNEEKEFNANTIADIDPTIFCERAKQYHITPSQAKRILFQLQSLKDGETTSNITHWIPKESPAPRVARLKVQPRLLKAKSLNALAGLDDKPTPLWKKEKWLRDKDKLDGIMDHLSVGATKPREKAAPPLLKTKSMNALQDREAATSTSQQVDELQQTIQKLQRQLQQDAPSGSDIDVMLNEIHADRDADDTKDSAIVITITPAEDTMDGNGNYALIQGEKKAAAEKEKPKEKNVITLKEIVADYMSLFDRIHTKTAEANRRQETLQATLLEAASMKSLDDCVEDAERELLMKEKLEICEYICDFNNKEDETEALCIENKKDLLVEVLQSMAQNKWDNMELFEQCMKTITHNLFRSLPEEDPFDDVYDAAWDHMQLIYELTYHVTGNTNIEKKTMQTYLEGSFLRCMIYLFSSADDREPEYVKIIVHQIYSRFMKLRAEIRKGLGEYCYPYIYLSTYRSDSLWQGIPQIIEIFGSVFQGLNVPVKSDYRVIMRNVILPLHKSFHLDEFHGELVLCCIYFLDKEPEAAAMILGAILKFWPKQNPLKEQLFMSEIIDILKVCAEHPNMKQFDPEFVTVTIRMLKKLAQCMGSEHHEVAEKALMVWNDETIQFFVQKHRGEVLEDMRKVLEENEDNHWSNDVRELTFKQLSLMEPRESEPETGKEEEKKRRKRSVQKESAD